MTGSFGRALSAGWFGALVGFLFPVIGFLLYSGVLLNGVFLFDDFEYVVGNVLLQDLSYFRDMSDPRVVGYLSFALNYALRGEEPFGYHLVNVVIHIANAVFVYLMVRQLYGLLIWTGGGGLRGEKREGRWGISREEAVGCLAGLIFLTHPVETQAVSYVTQRFTSLSTFFYLLGVVLYFSARGGLEEGRGGSGVYVPYAVSVASTILAMKTKEISFTLPFMLAAMELLVFRRSAFGNKRFLFLIPYAATLVIIPLSLLGPEWGLLEAGRGVDEVTRKDKLYDLYERSAYEYFATQVRVVVTYLRLLAFPVNQLVVYDVAAAKSLFEPQVLWSLIVHLGMAASALFLWRLGGRKSATEGAGFRMVSLGVVWFYATLSVESSAIPIKDIIFEHRVYLPSAGFFGGLASAAILCMDRLRRNWAEALKAAAVAVVIVVPLAFAAYARNWIWTDEVLFWDDVVKKNGKAIGYNNRGNAYLKEGNLELAIRDLSITIDIFEGSGDQMAWENADFTPTNRAKTYMSRGNAYYSLGDFERARADFDMAKRVMMLP